MSDSQHVWASRLVVAATSLFLVGAVTGILIPTAVDDPDKEVFARLVASHLNAILGCFWLLGLAWTLPRLQLSGGQVKALCLMTMLSAWANWGVTLAKAYMGHSALDWGAGGGNGALWIALVSTVVLPTLGAALLWALGAWKGRVSAS
jgi:hydroxylaminobenzene mutase